MEEFLKKAFNLGLGAFVVTKEKVEEVVDELVKKGELGHEEGKKLTEELMEKGVKTKKELESQIEKMVAKGMEKGNIATQKELDSLKAEIKKLNEELQNKK
ncbi:MAG: hypothetical protein KAJ48_10350 [Elusimicrobiales bacterium]|nr:hypothetical protein [Elusimicrobiales bacterium]